MHIVTKWVVFFAVLQLNRLRKALIRLTNALEPLLLSREDVKRDAERRKGQVVLQLDTGEKRYITPQENQTVLQVLLQEFAERAKIDPKKMQQLLDREKVSYNTLSNGQQGLTKEAV